MRFLVGSEPVRIYAETEQRIHTEHEDLFNGMIKFANGVIGVLNINWLTPTKRRALTVTGERGMYVADYISQDLDLLPQSRLRPAPSITTVAEGEMTRRAVRHEEPLAVELREFARAVRDGRPAAGRPARRDGRPAAGAEDGRVRARPARRSRGRRCEAVLA